MSQKAVHILVDVMSNNPDFVCVFKEHRQFIVWPLRAPAHGECGGLGRNVFIGNWHVFALNRVQDDFAFFEH